MHCQIQTISKGGTKTGQFDENGRAGWPGKMQFFSTISFFERGGQNGFWSGHWQTLARLASPWIPSESTYVRISDRYQGIFRLEVDP